MSGESDSDEIICADMKRYVEINEQLVGNSRYQVTINSYVVMKENKPFRGVDLITLVISEQLSRKILHRERGAG